MISEKHQMESLILDLRDVSAEAGETWADSDARSKVENALLNHTGCVVRVRISIIPQSRWKKYKMEVQD